MSKLHWIPLADGWKRRWLLAVAVLAAVHRPWPYSCALCAYSQSPIVSRTMTISHEHAAATQGTRHAA